MAITKRTALPCLLLTILALWAGMGYAQPTQIVAGYYNPADMVNGTVNESFRDSLMQNFKQVDIDGDGTDDCEFRVLGWTSSTGHEHSCNYILSGSPLLIPKMKFFVDTTQGTGYPSSYFEFGDTVQMANGHWQDKLLNYEWYEQFGAPFIMTNAPDSNLYNKYGIIRLLDNGVHRYGWVQFQLEVGTWTQTICGLPDTFQVTLQDFALGTSGMMVTAPEPESEAFSVSPNPFTEQLIIDSPKALKQVVLMDMMGRMVISESQGTETQGEIRLATAHLPAGTYLLLLEGENGSLHRQKLIKN